MKKILFTGGTGFLGRNLLPGLKKEYIVFAPKRSELDLKNSDEVSRYIIEKNIKIVVHAAIPNLLPNGADSKETLLKDSLLIFMNLFNMRNHYDKMIYFGSGAEFDKKFSIKSVKESDFGKRIPKEDYGFAKYIMNALCKSSDNVYNLRIFGCYGEGDAEFKLITHAIQCCMKNESITLHKDCIFNYIQVLDLLQILIYFIEENPCFHDYNICSKKSLKITEVCEIVKELMESSSQIVVENEGLGNEYTGDNTRITGEIKGLEFTPIKDGIKKQITFERWML